MMIVAGVAMLDYVVPRISDYAEANDMSFWEAAAQSDSYIDTWEEVGVGIEAAMKVPEAVVGIYMLTTMGGAGLQQGGMSLNSTGMWNAGTSLQNAAVEWGAFWTGVGGTGGNGEERTLFHYTDEDGYNGIVGDEELWASTQASNPRDVRYGNGQYLSDIEPGAKTPAQLSREFLGIPWQGQKYTHYVEINVTGLNVVQGRPGVFVIPNNEPLNLVGRIVGGGPVP